MNRGAKEGRHAEVEGHPAKLTESPLFREILDAIRTRWKGETE